MKRRLKITFGLLASGAVLLVSDPIQVSNLFVAQAEAVIGRPLTPVSFAGVARRTTRRTVYAATAVNSAAYSQNQAYYYNQQQADYYNQQQTAQAQQQTAEAQQQAAQAQQQAALAQQQAAQAQQQAVLPVGATLPSLPSGCDSATVNNQSYFTCGGNWYRPAMQNTSIVYEVVADPR